MPKDAADKSSIVTRMRGVFSRERKLSQALGQLCRTINKMQRDIEDQKPLTVPEIYARFEASMYRMGKIFKDGEEVWCCSCEKILPCGHDNTCDVEMPPDVELTPDQLRHYGLMLKNVETTHPVATKRWTETADPRDKDKLGEALVAESQHLKSLIGGVLQTRREKSGLSKDGQTFASIDALVTLAADVELGDGAGDEERFNVLVKKCWDWVQTVYNMKKAYDAMTPEEREAVIAGKTKGINPTAREVLTNAELSTTLLRDVKSKLDGN